MKMTEIKAIAKERGIKAGRLNKTDLVRTIQQQEGNSACFNTGQVDSCGQNQCLWHADCR
ncbi:MAG: SAP domain-containing protein [Desulfuromonas sp.]|nr:MAG: SAP domain-containing protein [Desulfuromonas sp.]